MRWPERAPVTVPAPIAPRRGVGRGVAVLAALLAAAGAPGIARAQQALVPGPILISNGHAVAADKGGTSTATLVIENKGTLEEHLVSVACPAAGQAALQPPAGTSPDAARAGVLLPAGTTVALDRNGWHVALSGLRAPLTTGEVIPCTVHLTRTGEQVVELTVAPPG